MWQIVAILMVLAILIISQKRIKSYFVGMLGEYRVAKQLKKLSKKKYRVINNILLKTKRGTVEIDHIVLSHNAVYVIETKNRKGIIYGAENWDYWTQKLYTKEHKFYSPIKQNNAHIEALRSVLKKYNLKYYSLIVFIKNANINKLNTMTMVINDDELLVTLKKHKGECYISDSKIKQIAQEIKKHTVTSIAEKSKHKRNVKKKAKLRKNRINSGICPRCGKKLVKQTKSNKVSYKCTDYPKCRVVIIKN